MDPFEDKVYELLKSHFGFEQFRPAQIPVIADVLTGKDVLTIMPTGGGKSLCYQLPALYFEGITVVISPLISLMKNQVDSLMANGIAAAYLNSSLSTNELDITEEKIRKGQVKIIYVAPESLNYLTALLQPNEVSVFAVDEAHCISSWGHDFRPAYTQISDIKNRFPNSQIIALTATADTAIKEDILKQLEIPWASVHSFSFDRPNIFLECRPGQKRLQQILQFLEFRPNTSGIIYCLSRKSTEELASRLSAHGYVAKPYHAGMTSEERSETQEAFLRDEVPVVVATIAFGMGIDKSNVRWVIHYNMPKNIEGYYQEIGRGGRDGLPAEALMFYGQADAIMLRSFIPHSAQGDVELQKLQRMEQFAGSLSCRRKALLSYFGEDSEPCGHCDRCKNPVDIIDGTIIAQKICSAVYRLKEQEPILMVVGVLRASKNQTLLSKGYDKIKTYGMLKDNSQEEVQEYIAQLLNQGILSLDFSNFAALTLSPLAHKVLFENKKVQLGIITQDSAKMDFQTEGTFNPLMEELKRLRLQLAKERNVPAYVIFSDATLQDMTRIHPTTMEEFGKVSGVGAIKLKEYGASFLEVFQKQKTPTQTWSTTYWETKNLFDEGLLPEEIAEHRGIRIDTVMTHLIRLKSGGEDIELEQFIDPGDKTEILAARDQVEEKERLKPIFEFLEEKHPYWKIRLVLAIEKWNE